MSLYGIPFLLANLGAQTIYVIDQRLRDQAIPENKAERILGDICAVLFSENLWEQIMAPQDMYTQDSTRSVLEKIEREEAGTAQLENSTAEGRRELAHLLDQLPQPTQAGQCQRPENQCIRRANYLSDSKIH